MIKLKVLDIIRELSKEELKKFSDYLCSPVFNKRKIIFNLFEVYRKHYPDFDNPNLTKEKVFKKLFPGKKYSDEIFRNLNSLLLKHAEEFLSFINYSRDEFSVKRHLLSELNHKKILSLFDKNFEEGRKMLDSSGQKDLDYFFSRFELYQQRDTYNSIINKFSKEDISEAEKSFLTFFIIKLIELQNYILYQCKVLGLDNSLYLKAASIDLIMKKIPEEISQLPQIQIYYTGLKLEQTGNEKYYTILKTLLSSYGSLLKKEELYNKYLYLINYIKTNHSTKEIKTNSELFQLRKEIIEKNLLMENTIKNMFFLNLVKSGLKIKEFDWIFDFIKNYQSLLIPKYKEVTVSLALALYYFEKKEFGNSLSYAARVKYEDNFYNLQAKNITLRIYFETNEFESMLNFISSYRMYLSKNRTLKKKEILSHNLFLNFTDKLIRVKEQKKFYKLRALLDEISGKDFVNNIWLIDKVKDMIRENKVKKTF
ncbi:MAG: hypothetical protein IPL53_16555 [Ignavibacteria bacterium]|nr:hypothetical protein [Ignavibacteria bacterium]